MIEESMVKEEEEEVRRARRLNHHKLVMPGHSFEGGFAYADGVGKFWVDFGSPFTKAPSTIIFPIGLYTLPVIGIKVPIPIILTKINKDGFEFWAPVIGNVTIPYMAFGVGGCE